LQICNLFSRDKGSGSVGETIQGQTFSGYSRRDSTDPERDPQNFNHSIPRILTAIWEVEIETLLYMIIERFRNRDPLPVYRRFRERGRLAPEGLEYVSSWVDEKLEICFQLMEAPDVSCVNEWIANWSDIVEFEVHPVISSKEAADRVLPNG
jgi:hypothetical protein